MATTTHSSTITYTAPEIPEVPAALQQIALCESGGKQFENGHVVLGVVNPHDVGKYQINLDAHGERAKKLGIDLYTLKGNTEYALLLYTEQGTAPWNYSKACWEDKII